MAWIPLAAAGFSAVGSIAGGLLANQQPKQPKVKETNTEKQRRQLLDEVIYSVSSGQGKFTDLFNMNEDDFNRTYVEPAKSRFKNQVAPAIKQQSIYGGQQYGTGLEDQLLRAGVDMDQLLNEAYSNERNNALNRRSNALNAALGSNTGQPTISGGGYSNGQAAGIAAGNYLASEGFGNNLDKILQEYNKPKPPQVNNSQPTRKGFESLDINFPTSLRG